MKTGFFLSFALHFILSPGRGGNKMFYGCVRFLRWEKISGDAAYCQQPVGAEGDICFYNSRR